MACIGLRDETESVRPLAMCQQCQHWQAGSGPVIRPHAIVIQRDGQQVLSCSRRVAAKPLPEVA